MPHAKKPKGKKGHPPSKSSRLARANGRAIASTKRPSLVLQLSDPIENALLAGDLSGLSVQQRQQYYKALCKTLGLNPLTRPFEYIVFSNRRDEEEEVDPNAPPPRGKMVLYARADCAAQLRKIHHVGSRVLERKDEGEYHTVTVEAYIHEKAGIRTDSAVGQVWLKRWSKKDRAYVQLKGVDLANARMRAETKAKRRATFSICGLHMLDQAELADLDVEYHEVSSTGRTIEITGEPQKALPAPDLRYDVAVLLAQAKSRRGELKVPFKDAVAEIEKSLASQTAAQLEELQRRMTQPPSSPGVPQGKAQGAGTATQAPAAPGPAPSATKLTITGQADGTYIVDGPKPLQTTAKDVLAPLWDETANAIVARDGNAVGKLIGALERLRVPYQIIHLREPGE